MNKTQLFFKKHSSTILTVVGSVGVVATSVLAVKATPKALQLIEEERQSRKEYIKIFADNEPYESVVLPDLTTKELVKVAWKPYIPAVIAGASTIACIFGANILNKRHQAALLSAYAVLDSSYREYREKTRALCGEKAKLIDQEIAKSNLDEDIEEVPDKELFFDMHTMQSFYATFEEVEEAEKLFNQNFLSSGFAYLNDYCEIMGMELRDYGYDIGWTAEAGEIKFEHEKAVMDDGLECWIISMVYPPTIECEC